MQDGGLVKRPFVFMFKTALLCLRFFTSAHLLLNASGKTTIFLWVVLSLRCREKGGVVEWDDFYISSQPLFTSSLVSVNAKADVLPTNCLTLKRLTWGSSRFVLFSTSLSCVAERGGHASYILEWTCKIPTAATVDSQGSWSGHFGRVLYLDFTSSLASSCWPWDCIIPKTPGRSSAAISWFLRNIFEVIW